jgi:hypothetical protein
VYPAGACRRLCCHPRARALLAVLFAMAVGLVLKAEAGAALLRL